MSDHSTWQYDEFKQVGKDYGDPAEVEVYDASHGDFRDLEGEADTVLDRLALGSDAILIDFGCGTGTFVIEAAKRYAQVFAVDVSPAMLSQAQTKAKAAGVGNIIFCHAGFLTYSHQGNAVDAVTTTFAFHHLPDFWKGIALQRLYGLLKPGGQFYLSDAIIEERNCLENISAFIDELAEAGGDFLREDTETHFREEYSSYDWVIDGLLERAGFEIRDKRIDKGVLGHYLCRKP